MKVINGTISGLLNDCAGEMDGFVLDKAQKIHFSPDQASRVLSIAILGSRVKVEAYVRSSFGEGETVNAVRITNLDSQQSATLYASPTLHNPEVSTDRCPSPGPAVSLAPPSAPLPDLPRSRYGAPEAYVIRRQIVDEIEQAHDALHQIQAMLTHLKIIKHEQFAISQYLDEAKHTYVEAVSRCQVRDFEGARELAAASNSLSRVVNILISKVYHSETDYPKLIASTDQVTKYGDERTAQDELEHLEHLLARISWVTENGTLPLEDLERVQKFSLWSANLQRWARCLLGAGATREAIDFAQAADAVACSAEHICKKCYVTRGADSQSIAVAR